MNATDAVIYLAESRTLIQDEKYRSYRSLKKPFNDLATFNDETLAAGASVRYEGPTLIIPLVGDVLTTRRINPGHAQVVTSPTITNPFKDELINFLVIQFQELIVDSFAEFELSKNTLTKISSDRLVYIGKFDGRHDSVHKLSSAANGVFVFAIEGAFEVQNRLIQPRDGLSLWNVAEVEFEALSNEAILLFIEV